jgi:N-acetylmuramoyl-L-alanine amidase
MTRGRQRFNRVRRLAALGALGVSLAALPVRAQAQAGADQYAQALAQDDAARADAATQLPTLRTIVKAYETFVSKYPTATHAAAALWQAAGLEALAYTRFADSADEQHAQRLLGWLRQEYPTSSLAKRAASLLAGHQLPPSGPPSTLGATPTVAAPPASTQAASSAATVRSVTRSALPRGDRLTIEFSQEVPYSGDRISSPDRVYFDFRNAAVPAAVVERAQTIEGTLLKSLRIARHDERTMRVVLELAGSPRFSVFATYDPFRLVIDLEADTAVSKPAADSRTPTAPDSAGRATPPTGLPVAVPAGAPSTAPAEEGMPAPPTSTGRGDYSLSRQLGLGVARIVIDPGHGGHDPGAQSNDIDEAELVLDVALRLEKLLQEQPGVDVVLTRRTDEFIPLDERTAIANREGADLFLSIHANASREPAARGVETYFLNFATTPTAEAVAARENAASSGTMGKLPELVKTIALNNKVAESREMATVVQASLIRHLKVQNKTVRDLGVKQAPFVVLIGAQMPSILAEISFVTNRTEATLLKQSAYRQRIAQALADAVLSYRSSLKKVTTLAVKDRGK